jgi:hypothetical protein
MNLLYMTRHITHGRKRHFASFHSAFKSLRIISVVCLRETSLHPSFFSHPGCVHWYGFNFKCTVSTCLRSASCKSLHTARNHKVAIFHEPRQRDLSGDPTP